MNIQPLSNHLLIRPDSTKPVVDIKDFALPENLTPEEPTTGEVLAIGTRRTDAKGRPIPWDIKPGDRIAYRLYAAAPVTKTDTAILKAEDVLGILEPENGRTIEVVLPETIP